MIADYLQGINNATSGQQQDVKTATTDLSNLQVGAGSLPSKLKEALNTKLNNNQDIINQQASTMQNYFNSGSQAREKYQNVFDPFKKAALVEQEKSMALKPYDVLSGVLENRMGQTSDIVNAGVQGWQGLMDAATTKLSAAQTNLSTALQSYQAAATQQQQADALAQAQAAAAEAKRQFGIQQDLEQQKVNNQVSQFASDQALQLKLSGMKNGNANDPGAMALQKAIEFGTDPTTGKLDPDKMGQYIAMNQAFLEKEGVNVQNLWDARNSLYPKATTTTPVTPTKNYAGQAASTLGDYYTKASNLLGVIPGTNIPNPKIDLSSVWSWLNTPIGGK